MPLDIDRFAHVESPLQRWDPRVKIFSLGLFVFGIAIVKTLPVAIIALLIAIYLIRLSGLPFDFIYNGMKWVVFFLLPFFIILPISYPGEAAFHILGIPFVMDGFRLATLIIIKATSIVLTSFAIFGSARFDVSMIALQHLKVPSILVQMLLFTYRYTFVFLEEMRRMQVAMKVRGFVMKSDVKTLKVMGDFVGTLLVRSFERSERVYKAMLSKGYQGELHTMVRFEAGKHDYIKCGCVLIVAIGLLTLDFSGTFTQAVKGWY